VDVECFGMFYLTQKSLNYCVIARVISEGRATWN